MRLIDADKLEYGIVAYIGEFSRVPLDDIINGWRRIVNSQPTVYDVDKVVERLESQKSGLTTWAEDEAYKLGIEKAIEIVKSGEIE